VLREALTVKRRALQTVVRWIFLFFILIVPAQLLTADEEYDSRYGSDLKGVPFAVRFHFQEEFGRSWREASYEERFGFIQQWEQSEQQQKDLEAQEKMASEQALEQKRNAKAQAKMAEQQRASQREQARQARLQAEQQKKQQFEQKVQQQKQKMEQMKQRQQQMSNR